MKTATAIIAKASKTRGRRDGRRFMRHPTSIPLTCRRGGHASDCPGELRDASLGGVSFLSDDVFATGDVLDLAFPVRESTASFRGKVVWHQELGGSQARRHAYGVLLCDPELLPRTRLLEQICHIEAYRATQARTRNRLLSSRQAAEEWIARYAARFPQAE